MYPKRSLTNYENCCSIGTQVFHQPQRMPGINRTIREHHVCDLHLITPIICVCAFDATGNEVSVKLWIVDVLTLFDEEVEGELEAKGLLLVVRSLVVAKLCAGLIGPLST